MRCPSWRRGATAVAAVLVLAVCTDPPTAPIVEDIELSVPATGTEMFFREPLDVTAAPVGHLGGLIDVTMTWTSKNEAIVTVLALPGNAARISATGVGTAELEVSAGSYSERFQITVLDTVYSVSVTPPAMNLVAGDTVSLYAAVDGSANALRRVRWTTSSAAVQLLSSPDSNPVLIKALASGSAAILVRAIADTMKSATASFSTELGTLFFQQQPSTVRKGAAMGPDVRVVLQDGSGNISLRATNAITLSETGSCTNNSALAGTLSTTLANGVAAFGNLTMDRVSTSCRLRANASPPALAATSTAFDVSPRGCDPISFKGGELNGVIETSDCPEVRQGATFYTHIYSITVPSTALTQAWRFDVGASFSARLEAQVWPPAAAFRDTSGTTSVAQMYVLAPGTYRFSVTSSNGGEVGTYTLSSGSAISPRAGQPSAQNLCHYLATTGIDDQTSSIAGPCFYPVQSRGGGTSSGRAYIVYVPANQEVTVTLRANSPGSIFDAYLEINDVTVPGTRTLVTFDDNGGGGTDARAVIPSGPTNRFIEIVATAIGGVIGGSYVLSIR